MALRTSVGVRYLFGDHLGSTSVTADVSGGSVTKQLYKAWGETRFTSGSLPTRYQYTGQYSYATGATGDFGLLFYNARWFDPALARFTSADSIIPDASNPVDFDRYSYGRNNPLCFNDPTGHWPNGMAVEGDPQTPYQFWALITDVTKPVALMGKKGLEAQYIVVESPNYFSTVKSYSDKNHYNLCGQLSFASIYESQEGGNSLAMIWELYPTLPEEGTDVNEWAKKINTLPGWNAEEIYFNSSNPYQEIKSTLDKGANIMFFCTLDTITGKIVSNSNLGKGSNFVRHYVSVKAVNSDFILIYNPYINDFQRYSWDDFTNSWGPAIVITHHHYRAPQVKDRTT